LWTALVVGLGLAGCKTSTGSHALPSDPLLFSKKPVEGKAGSGPPTQLAQADPLVPPSRLGLLARTAPPGSISPHPTTAEPPLPDRLIPVSDRPSPIVTPTAVRASSASLEP
jgi:hypothetical protein